MKRNFVKSLTIILCTIAVVAPALVYFDILFGGKTISFNPRVIEETPGISIITVSDPAAGSWQDGPWLHFIQQSLFQGRLPVANLDNAMGEPFVESLQTGAFYPPNIFLLLLSSDPIELFDRFEILHLYILLLGFFLLARQYLLAPAALFFALSATLSGAVFQNINMVHFRAYSWLPYILCGAIRWARRDFRYGTTTVLLAVGIIKKPVIYSHNQSKEVT